MIWHLTVGLSPREFPKNRKSANPQLIQQKKQLKMFASGHSMAPCFQTLHDGIAGFKKSRGTNTLSTCFIQADKMVLMAKMDSH